MKRLLILLASSSLIGAAHAVTLDMAAICAALDPGQHVDIRGNRFERVDGSKCSATNLRAGWRVDDNSDRIVGTVRP